MRAIVSSSTGAVMQEFEDPSAGPGCVLVKVKAASLNRADLDMLHGGGHGAAGGMGLPLGLEWSGDVIAVGPGVEAFKVGSRVMGASPGAFTELVASKADWVHPIPDSLSYEEAAALLSRCRPCMTLSAAMDSWFRDKASSFRARVLQWDWSECKLRRFLAQARSSERRPLLSVGRVSLNSVRPWP